MLKCDFGNLRREIELLDLAETALLHWDVMDGHFVPNLSYGAMLIEKVRPLTRSIFYIFLSVFGGIKFFGPIGIIYGPLIMTLVMAMLKIYTADYRDALAPSGHRAAPEPEEAPRPDDERAKNDVDLT